MAITGITGIIGFVHSPLAYGQTPPKTAANQTWQTMWDEKTLYAYMTATFLAMDQQFEAAANTLLPFASRLRSPELLEQTAQWAMQGRRADIAYAALRQWEQLEPNNAKLRLTADTLLLQNKQLATLSKRHSERYGDSAAKTNPAPNPKHLGPSDADLAYLQQLGMQPNLNEDLLKALYVMSLELLKPYEAQGSVQYTLGGLAARAGLKPASKTHLQAAATATPPHVASLGALAVIAPETAVQSGIAWTQREPKNVDAWRTLGLIYAKVNQAPQAEQAFSQAITLAPNDIGLHLERKEQLIIARQYDSARAALLAAYALRSQLSRPEVAYALAEQLEDNYHYAKALELYKQAQTLSQTQPENEPIEQLAQVKQLHLHSKMMHSKDPALAGVLDDLQAAQANAKGLTKPTVNHIVMSALREHDRFEPALALVAQLPEDEQAYEKALILETMGQPSKSEALLRQALEKTPESSTLLNMLGYGLIDRNQSQKDLAEGTQFLEKAYAIYPNSYAILDSLGWAYFRAKNHAKALVLLQQAYEQRRDPEVAAHLGEVLYVTGKPDQARNIWAQALILEPHHKVLNQTINRFK